MQQTGTIQKKKVILALQGGGVYGAFTWGVLERLLEDERIEIVGVTGSSIGAINAAALVYGLDTNGREGAKKTLNDIWTAIEMGDLWDDVSWGKPFKKIESIGKRYLPSLTKLFSKKSRLSILALFNNVASRKYAQELYTRRMQDKLSSIIDFERLKNHKKGIPFFINATDILSHEQVIFTRDTISADAIAASCAIPGVFPSVSLHGRTLIDGCLSENPPFSPVKKCDASDIIIIQNTSLAASQETPPRNKVKISDFSEHFLSASIRKNVEDIQIDNERIALNPKAAQQLGLKKLNTHLIHDCHELNHYGLLTALKFDKDVIEEYRKTGYEQADLWLKNNFQAIGQQSSYKPKFTKKIA